METASTKPDGFQVFPQNQNQRKIINKKVLPDTKVGRAKLLTFSFKVKWFSRD
jgi:hypothetical protein